MARCPFQSDKMIKLLYINPEQSSFNDKLSLLQKGGQATILRTQNLPQMTFDPSNKANSHDTLSNILHVPKIALFLRIACALDCIMPEELHYCMCPKIKLFARIACARDCIFPEYCMSPNIALCPRIALCTKIAYARTNLN